MFICLLLLRRCRRIISGPCKSPSPPLSVFSTRWHNKHGAHPQREEQSQLEPCQRVLEGNKRLRCRASEVSEGFFVSGFFARKERLVGGRENQWTRFMLWNMLFFGCNSTNKTSAQQLQYPHLINNSLVRQRQHKNYSGSLAEHPKSLA